MKTEGKRNPLFFANKYSGVVHSPFCPFHPSEHNLVIYEELYQALGDGYEECSYCFGNGEYWPRLNLCFSCEVFCNVWDNFCPNLRWSNDQAYCKLRKIKTSRRSQ